MPLKSAVKRSLRILGYKIEKIDPLEGSIPVDYNHSPFLPRVYRGARDRYGDARWPGATKAIDEFFGDKPETVRPHPKCTWKYHVVKH